MGINNYDTKNEGDVILADDPNQYEEGLTLDVVPRDASGVPSNAAGSLGTDAYKWNNGKFDGIVEADDFNLTANRPVSKSLATIDTDGSFAADAVLGGSFDTSGGSVVLADDSVGIDQLAQTARSDSFFLNLGTNSTSSTSFTLLTSNNGFSIGLNTYKKYLVFYIASADNGGMRNTTASDDTAILRFRNNSGSPETIYASISPQPGASLRSSGHCLGIVTLGPDLVNFDVYWRSVSGLGVQTQNAGLQFVGFPWQAL